ncbi:MAG: AI-2E family transporter [Halohasta sp.]
MTDRERRRGRLIWLLVGVSIAGLVAYGLLTQLGTLVFAVFFYYATRPLYRRLDAHIDHPNLTASLTIIAIVIPILLVVGYASIQVLSELDGLLATYSLSGYRRFLRPYLSLVQEGQFRRLAETLLTNPDQPLPDGLRRVAQRLLGGVSTLLGAVVSLLGHLFLLSVFLFYFLRDDHRLAAWFHGSVDDERVAGFTRAVDSDLQTVFFSNLAIVAVSGGVAVATFWLLNAVVPGPQLVAVPILLGLLIGIATLVPVFGMKLVYVPYTVYLLGAGAVTPRPLWHAVVFFLVTAIVVDFIPDIFVRSYLSAQSGVHMGLILVGYVVGSLAFGWYGLFLGPVVVVLAVHFAHQIIPDLADHVEFG